MLNIPLLRTKIIPPPRHARTLPRQRVSQTLKQALDYRLTLLQAGAGYGKSTALAELAGQISPFIWYQVAGRPTLTLPALARLRAQGEVLMFDQSVLTFTRAEIAELFGTHYDLELNVEEVDALLTYSEGWAIALQLIWQNLRSQPSGLDFSRRWQANSLDSLFEVLTREVFDRQPADIRDFLLVTATLRDLNLQACDALLGGADSAAMLAYLKRQDLFVSETAGGVLRYHHIFHEFLRQQTSAAQRETWNRAAAAWFLKQNDPENALYHLLEARAWNQAADLLDSYAAALLATGRLDMLAAYIHFLPAEILHQHPGLVFTLGELARLHSRFDEALGWYAQSEAIWRAHGQQDGIARALRGQARVYLDTVNPSRAEELLETALRLSDGFHDREVQVRLLELLAENKLNAGRVQEAERLRQRAEELRLEGPSNEELLFRVWLRTGRLNEARSGLESRLQAEKRQPVQTPRAHRETLLILSLIYSFMGLGEQAYQTALQGTRRGDELQSPFITAVGYMRQGHSLMLLGGAENYARAREQYEKSIEISRALAVPRLRVESGWGLCRAYGFQGDLLKAQQHAQEAIEIAVQAGDEWIASLVRLTMGASLGMAARYEAAEDWLNRAAAGFQECSDPFGRSAARLWFSLGYFRQKQTARLAQILAELLSTCRANGYDFLFTRPSLLGAPDERMFVPLLLYARQNGWETVYIGQLLDAMGLTGLEVHPGYQLRVQTLGAFQVWRGAEAIPANGWRREKARQLFQILLTYRHTPLDRDQICEFLWPEADPLTAQRNFKTTLNTLYQVLEPERTPGADSAYILRDGSTYSLRPYADLWLDADEFVQRVRRSTAGEMDELQKALDLYRGEYLPDALYETWAAEKRERLVALFLESADHLVEYLLEQARYAEAIELAQRVLAQDNCWERAYRHLMLAYARLGDRGQVARVYQRCVQTLRAELDVSPSPETESLYSGLVAV